MNELERKVVELIMPDDLTKLVQDIVRIPSVSGDEEEVASFMADKMKEWGMEVTTDYVLPRRPNIYGVLRGEAEGPKLLFNGHTDIVPPGHGWEDDPYSGLIREGRLHGRGSADMKGGLAAMMFAAKALKQAAVELRGSLTISAVIAEEDDQKGTLRLVERKTKTDLAVVGEPTELNVCNTHKGDATYEITAKGKSAHSSVPHEGINAIYKMSKVVNAIEEFSDQLQRRNTHPSLGSATMSVGTISGGDIPWNVPSSCRILVDRRILPDENAETGRNELESILQEFRDHDLDFATEVKLNTYSPAMETPPDHMLVRVFSDMIAKVTGQNPQVKGIPYTTDGGILNKTLHVPTIVFGPGDIRHAHKPDESIALSEVFSAAKVYALAALHILSSSC